MDADLLYQTHERFDTLLLRIRKIRSNSTKMQLLEMSTVCSKFRNLISIELVECRRLRKVTIKCQDLINSYVQSVNTLEEHIVFGLLVDG